MNITELLAEADARAAKGQIPLAEAFYRQVLDQIPLHPAALFGLGRLALERADPAQAEAFFAGAVRGMPGHPAYRVYHGMALRQLDVLDQAIITFQAAIRLVPDAVQPWLGLIDCLLARQDWPQARAMIGQAQQHGVTVAPLLTALGQGLARAGLTGEAEQAYGDAIAMDPAEQAAWLARASLHLKNRQLADALRDARQAVALDEGDARALVVLAAVLRAHQDLVGAIAAARQAVQLSPRLVDACAELGTLLHQAGEDAEGATHLLTAYRMAPHRLDVAYNLAACFMAAEDYPQAGQLYRQCAEAKPDWRDARTNLGVALLRQGRLSEAEVILQQAVAIPEVADAAGSPEARYNLAWVQLLQGNFRAGWQNYEARWDLPDFSSPRRPLPVPLWTGQADPALHLLLHAEQGLGDSLQMMQLVAQARQRVGRVTLEVPPALYRLALAVAGVDQVVMADLSDPARLPVPCDAHAPLMSLPLLLGLGLSDLPRATAYLNAPVPTSALCLPDSPLPRVGFVWAGSPDNKIDRYRTIPWPLFAPLAAGTGCAPWSLQWGQPPPEGINSCMAAVKDMADTASVIAQLDLVIGVDTAVLHLAAAMGRPAWMLIPFAPDYRWLATGDGSPWYPSLRLFRQHRSGAWADVVAEVRHALSGWVSEWGSGRIG